MGMGVCVCMEASATKDIIYTRGDFLKTPGVPPSSRLGLDSLVGLRVLMGFVYV